MAEEKSFAPTEHKLKEARKKGKVLKSRLLTGSAVFAMVSIATLTGIHFFFLSLQFPVQYDVGEGISNPVEYFQKALQLGFWAVLLPVSVGALTAILVEGLQSGFVFEWAALVPRPERLNPFQGVKNIFIGFRDLWQILFRLALPGVVFWVLLFSLYKRFPVLFFQTNEMRISSFTSGILSFVLWSGGVLVIAGLVEFGVNYKRFYKELSMSHDEVRREHKDQEGDPLFRSVRKSMHETILSEDVVQRVRKAKVVVVENNSSSQ